jgi:solute carrier family 50 protein (sugar transporter)
MAVSGAFSDFITVMASLSTLVMFSMNFAPYREVWRDKSWGYKSSIPVLGIILNCTAWATYGIFTDQPAVIYCNSWGWLVGFIGVCLFAKYASNAVERRRVGLLFIAIISGLFALFAAYGISSAPGFQAKAIGYTACICTLLMYAAPLTAAAQIIKNRDSSPLSFPVVLGSEISSILWSTYGFIMKDLVIIIPNVIATCIVFVQFTLYCSYPRKAASIELPDASASQAVVDYSDKEPVTTATMIGGTATVIGGSFAGAPRPAALLEPHAETRERNESFTAKIRGSFAGVSQPPTLHEPHTDIRVRHVPPTEV